ncbi:hypothetical protein U0C82_01265 [Fulvimarina sp. 2208YS6-2-32]|uniref:Uncharacterized protein n=1 Tax=Fulvimarina uroteuthidis TaxID=3098149 RepID=A0ABU5HXB1_9HYPH|nr:hypothetical protein [Fulvimarina sp. 2208YS6-2-32]MDY8107775.1 hypothetical protein [Fulvimarina sp. 2208YS6-2-32]
MQHLKVHACAAYGAHADDDHQQVSELLVSVAAEMRAIAEGIEDLGGAIMENADTAPDASIRLQEIDRSAQILTNLSCLLERVSSSICDDNRFSDVSLRETMLMSDLYARLSKNRAPAKDPSAHDDCDFF